MVQNLPFALISPERVLFSGQVDQVDLPGEEGDLGILPNHAPLMTVLRTGVLTTYIQSQKTVYFVQGGFADVNADGLTVLAEKVHEVSELSKANLQADIVAAEAALDELSGEAALRAQQNLDGIKAAMTGL